MSHGPIYLWQLIYQAKTDVVNRGAAETVSVDRWLQPLSLPTPPKPGLHVSRQQFQPYTETQQFPETVTESRWHQPWSEPSVKTKAGLPAGEQQFLASQPNPIISIPWFNWLSEPVRTKLGIAASAQQFLALTEAAPFPESISEDRFHQPWSEPVRQKVGIAATQHPFVAFDPFPFVSFSWFNPLSEPSRRATNAALQSTTAFTPFIASTASVDGWGTALSEIPPKPKPGLLPAQQQFLALAEAAPFPETVSEDRFHQAWAEPVRTKPGLLVGQQQALAFVTVVTTTPSVDGWATAFADVPKPKLGLPAGEQQTIAYTEAAPFPESISEDRFHQPWSEPVRVKPALPGGEQQAAAFVSVVTTPSVDGWGSAFAEVPKAKPGLPASQQQTTAFDPAVFVASIDGWGSPFAEVPKPKAGTTAACQQFFAFDPAVFVAAPDAWAPPWSEPPKPKTSLNVAAQQALAFDPAVFVPSIATWQNALAEPVRIQPRITSDALFFPPNFTTAVAPNFGYFSPFSEPQRQLAGLAARYQQDAAYGFVPIVQAFVFFFGNEEPYPYPTFRQVGFVRENYDQLAFPPFPIPNPPQTQALFTVSGPTVSDIFPTPGVVYTRAPETRQTVPGSSSSPPSAPSGLTGKPL